ncbi:MAG: ABC transporter substrate-binding protein [Eubacteriales bacterium]|nr:ABC transporter substrate-binding protein [Eubacteriales bacterium]
MKNRCLALFLCIAMMLSFGMNAQAAALYAASATVETAPLASDIPEKISANEPVTIENMGITTTYEKAPESAVALSYTIAEVMIALGLKDKIVATAASMCNLDFVSKKYRDEVASLPLLEGNYGVPTLETVLNTNAEFVYGDSYSFYASSVGLAEDFLRAGVKIYATEGTYAKNPTFENVYHDILNIGKIFRVDARAEELVAELRAKEARVKEKVRGLEPVNIFYYDSDTGGGVTMSTIGNTSFQLHLLELAGCKNIFDDVDGEFISVSWEEVIARDPEYILVCDYYGSGYAEEKIAEMKKNPDTANMNAVKNDRFVIVPGHTMFPSMECIDNVELVANATHP